MGDSEKTIFLAIDQGFAARYLLRTDIFRTLKEEGVRLVILTPNSDERYFSDEFAADNVLIEKYEFERGLAYLRQSRFQHIFRRLRDFTVKASADLGTIKVRRKRYRVKSTGTKRVVIDSLIELPVPVLRHSQLLRQALIRLETALYSPEFHRDLFQRYNPNLVVLAGMGNWRGPDAYLMREAHKHGAKVVSVILSWDNTSTRGMGGANPDYVIAWTEMMKRELTEYYDIEEKQIFVGGVAHWDTYYSPSGLSKTELFQRFGLDPERKLILFGTGSPTIWAELNLEIIESIGQAIAQGRFIFPCQMLVRLHPIYMSRQREAIVQTHWQRLNELIARYPHVMLNTPKVSSRKVTFDLAPSEAEELKAMLRSCDVLVNTYSTLMLEASIFQRPIINVCFDKVNPSTGLPYEVFLNYPHLKRILDTGGTRTAQTPEELIALINMYLQHPELDSEGRERIRINECGPYPGTAGRTIAKYLLGLLEDGWQARSGDVR